MAVGMEMGLNFPLMSIVDYGGFRIVTVSFLPISERTLCYGSSDGGATMHYRDATLIALVDKLCQYLNLKQHEVGGHSVGGPFDMEAHIADNHYFLVDFARVFPPGLLL
jgi:hypothetical protein